MTCTMIGSLVGAHRQLQCRDSDQLYPLYAKMICLLAPGPLVQLTLDMYCLFFADFSTNYQFVSTH